MELALGHKNWSHQVALAPAEMCLFSKRLEGEPRILSSLSPCNKDFPPSIWERRKQLPFSCL